jgi:hypothetical protein
VLTGLFKIEVVKLQGPFRFSVKPAKYIDVCFCYNTLWCNKYEGKFMTTEMTEKLEAEFVSLVKQSWKTHQIYYWNDCVDEILIGAVINASLEKEYLLIDIASEQPYAYAAAVSTTQTQPEMGVSRGGLPINSHFLRFENPKDNSRLIYKLDRITTDLAETKVLGQLANVTIGYGEKAKNFTQTMDILKQELKTSFVDTSEPGIITFDADMNSGYVYAQVSIIINISDYNVENQLGNIDYDKLNYHIEAVVHSLKKYLKGRGIV